MHIFHYGIIFKEGKRQPVSKHVVKRLMFQRKPFNSWESEHVLSTSKYDLTMSHVLATGNLVFFYIFPLSKSNEHFWTMVSHVRHL